MTSADGDKLRKLVVVTATYPWGERESFLGPELEVLARLVDMVVVPVWPQRPRPSADRSELARAAVPRHPVGFRVLVTALCQIILRPRPSLRGAGLLWSGGLRVRAKNLVILPKALWLARLLRRVGADHVHAYWASIPASVAMVAAESAGVSWSMTAHRGDVAVGNLLGEKLSRATVTRCVSSATVDLIREQVGDVPASSGLRIIHLGVHVPEVPLVRVRSSSRQILCVARLIPLKRHTDLLQALSALRARGVDVRLDLAGDGPLAAELEALIDSLQLTDRVRMLGHVPNEEVLARYLRGEVDLVVLASDVEGIPVSLMEAMSLGVPVVATAVGGVLELLHDGAGVVVPPGDVPALTDAIDAVLKDRALWQRLSSYGQERVRAEFDASCSAIELMDLLGGPDRA